MPSKDTLKNLEKLKKLGLVQAMPAPHVVFPTPIDTLNELLPGGMVGGKQHLLFGAQQLGKTTLAIGTVAKAMQSDPTHITLLIPAERGEEYSYYEKLGLDFQSGRVMVMELPQYMLEDTLEKLETYLCDEDGECLINSFIIDSWDALIGNKEMYTPDGKKKEATRETVGVKAAGASKMLKRIKGHVADNKVLDIIICQARTALGGYVAYEKFSGGQALEHYTDVTLHLTGGETIKQLVDGREIPIGKETKITLDKSKVNGNAHRSVSVPYIYNVGWDNASFAIGHAINIGVIEKGGGGWYQYPAFEEDKKGVRKMRGEAAIKEYFKDPANLEILTAMVEYADEFIKANPDTPITQELMNTKYKELCPDVIQKESTASEE